MMNAARFGAFLALIGVALAAISHPTTEGDSLFLRAAKARGARMMADATLTATTVAADCSPGCKKEMIGNGICDIACSTAACGWDGGTDCKALRAPAPPTLPSVDLCSASKAASGYDAIRSAATIAAGHTPMPEGPLFPGTADSTVTYNTLLSVPARAATATATNFEIVAAFGGNFGSTENVDVSVVLTDGTNYYGFDKHDVSDARGMGSFRSNTGAYYSAATVTTDMPWTPTAPPSNPDSVAVSFTYVDGSLTVSAWNGAQTTAFGFGVVPLLSGKALTVELRRESARNAASVQNFDVSYKCITNVQDVVMTGPTGSSGTAKLWLVAGDTKLSLQLAYTLSAASTVTIAHVHAGCPGASGAPLASTDPTATWNGGIATTVGVVQTFDLAADQLAAIRSGCTYVNVHSNLYPNGEIRGQIPPTVPAKRVDSFAVAWNPTSGSSFPDMTLAVGQSLVFTVPLGATNLYQFPTKDDYDICQFIAAGAPKATAGQTYTVQFSAAGVYYFGDTNTCIGGGRLAVAVGPAYFVPNGDGQLSGTVDYAVVTLPLGSSIRMTQPAAGSVRMGFFESASRLALCDFTNANWISSDQVVQTYSRATFAEAKTYYLSTAQLCVPGSTAGIMKFNVQDVTATQSLYVDGSVGIWSEGTTYADIKAQAGDMLTFLYNSSYSVTMVDKAAFTSCNVAGAPLLASGTIGGGKDAGSSSSAYPNKFVYILSTPGVYYFTSLKPGSCSKGLKVKVFVGGIVASDPLSTTTSSTYWVTGYGAGSSLSGATFTVPTGPARLAPALTFGLAQSTVVARNLVVEVAFTGTFAANQPLIVLTDGTAAYAFRKDNLVANLGSFYNVTTNAAGVATEGAWTSVPAGAKSGTPVPNFARVQFALFGNTLTVKARNGGSLMSFAQPNVALDASKLRVEVRRDTAGDSYTFSNFNVELSYLPAPYYVAGSFGACGGCNSVRTRTVTCVQDQLVAGTVAVGVGSGELSCTGVKPSGTETCNLDSVTNQAIFSKAVVTIHYSNGLVDTDTSGGMIQQTFFPIAKTFNMNATIPNKGPVTISAVVYNPALTEVFRTEKFLTSEVTNSRVYFSLSETTTACDTTSKGYGYASITQALVPFLYQSPDYAWQKIQKFEWAGKVEKAVTPVIIYQ